MERNHYFCRKNKETMNITILDGYTLNPGDLSWEGFETLGNVTLYDRTPAGLVVERALDAEVVLTNKTVIDEEAIRLLPKLRYIGIFATGYNVVDVKAASEAGITVCNVPAYSTDSVAQQIFALLLTICNHAEYHAEQNRLGRWCQSADFAYSDFPLMELAGRSLGIVGYGHIGKATARIAAAFGMKVAVCSSKPQEQLPEVVKTDLDHLFSDCDVVCLCCPLTESNRVMVNARLLGLMKPTAIFINTARGGLVDEAALAEALNEGRLYAAGLDVLCSEPPRCDNPLLKARNCYVTPHVAWATQEARRRCMEISVANLRQWMEGEPQNVVS